MNKNLNKAPEKKNFYHLEYFTKYRDWAKSSSPSYHVVFVTLKDDKDSK